MPYWYSRGLRRTRLTASHLVTCQGASILATRARGFAFILSERPGCRRTQVLSRPVYHNTNDAACPEQYSSAWTPDSGGLARRVW